MSDSFIEELTSITLENLENIAHAKSVIGDPIQLGDDTVMLPISRLSIGYAAGGSHLSGKSSSSDSNPLFCGGSGGGASITPQAFVVVTSDDIKVINLDESKKMSEELIEKAPHAFERIQNILKTSGKRKRRERRSRSDEDE